MLSKSELTPILPLEALDRFWAKVDRTGDCWLWTAGVTQDEGYPRFKLAGKTRYAHRLVYATEFGPIPDGYTVDHLCHNRDEACPGGRCLHRRCVNPAHLEAVPQATNTLRGKSFSAINAAKTHCVRGHEFTPENTMLVAAGRECRQCRETVFGAAYRHDWYLRNKK